MRSSPTKYRGWAQWTTRRSTPREIMRRALEVGATRSLIPRPQPPLRATRRRRPADIAVTMQISTARQGAQRAGTRPLDHRPPGPRQLQGVEADLIAASWVRSTAIAGILHAQNFKFATSGCHGKGIARDDAMPPFGMIRAGADKVGRYVAPIVAHRLRASAGRLAVAVQARAAYGDEKPGGAVPPGCRSAGRASFWRYSCGGHASASTTSRPRRPRRSRTPGSIRCAGCRTGFSSTEFSKSAIAKSTAEAPFALIAIDVDRFKSVNDSHGHGAGDRLICAIVERIRRVIREGDNLARVGGDEFALILTDIGSAAKCAAMAHRLHDAMIAPFDLGRAQVHATLSLGIGALPAGRRQPCDTDASLRSRAVPGQARGPQPLRFLRQDDGAEASPRPHHRGRPAQGHRRGPADDPLPAADGRLRDAHAGPRGAGALAPCRTRHDVAGGVHPACREPRADRAARRMGAPPRLPRRAALAAAAHRRQRLAGAVSPARLRREGARHHRVKRHRRRPASISS